MSDPSDPLTLLQARVVAYLASDGYFTPALPAPPITLLSEQIGDIVNEIERLIGSIGIIGIVITPVGRGMDSDKRPIDFEVPLVIQFQEDVTNNRQSAGGTGKPALGAVCRTMELLHWWDPLVMTGSAKIFRLRLAAVPYELVDQTPVLTYNVNLLARICLAGAVATPAESGDLVTTDDGDQVTTDDGDDVITD